MGIKGGFLLTAFFFCFESRGAFDATCRPCTLDIIHGTGNVLLKCNCLDEVRFPRYTSLEMGLGGMIVLLLSFNKADKVVAVSNLFAVRPVNGRLVCGNHGGMQSPTYFP